MAEGDERCVQKHDRLQEMGVTNWKWIGLNAITLFFIRILEVIKTIGLVIVCECRYSTNAYVKALFVEWMTMEKFICPFRCAHIYSRNTVWLNVPGISIRSVPLDDGQLHWQCEWYQNPIEAKCRIIMLINRKHGIIRGCMLREWRKNRSMALIDIDVCLWGCFILSSCLVFCMVAVWMVWESEAKQWEIPQLMYDMKHLMLCLIRILPNLFAGWWLSVTRRKRRIYDPKIDWMI